ncbi:MAG: endopeptidase La, partial [Spirochaetes bacterium]|nr:endopeptidase La [Spirochaetota bacterium]
MDSKNNHDDIILNNDDLKANNNQGEIIPVSQVFPNKLNILPMNQRPVFPHIMMPLTFSGEKYLELIKDAYETEHRYLGVVLVKKENKEDFFQSDFYQVGTIVKIYKLIPIDEQTVQLVVQGVNRFRFVKVFTKEPILKWEVEYFPEEIIKPTDELKAYIMAIMNALKELLSLNPIFKEQIKLLLSQLSFDKQEILLDTVSTMVNGTSERLQDLLETTEIYKRCEKLLILLKEEIEISQIQDKIQKQIEEKVSKQQKEFFLREQLKVIKKELGLEKDDKASEIEKIENRIKNLKFTEEAAKVIYDELEKLKLLETSSPEFQVTRSYLNSLIELPWGIYSKDRISIKRAHKILNDQHYGLDDVKNVILQFISTLIKKGSIAGSILCLVGPPGVGKTSIGHSIAEALNRKFFRFSVGGMRDEAEIKGHRRTYIGAMPGKIIQSLKRTEVANPVIMIDEIDKIGSSFRGDPASALLEVLDPEQNKDFLDHYLDVRFDLSKILFVTTANQLDTIPRPLLDRMEIIHLAGYILEEKVQIAKRYLIPKQLESHGLTKKEVKITDTVLKNIIDGYAREAGVRNLEKQIKKVMRSITLELAQKKEEHKDQNTITINTKNIEKYLGKKLFSTEELYKKSLPGVTLGLAWTSMGGTTLYIEASAIPAKGPGFKQTGQLGKVMLESSEIAYSFIRSNLCSDKNCQDFFANHFIHLHVPAGATPKDGPSAGITMTLALHSLVTNKPIRKNLAMTGEITLTGKILPIGGVREKAIAARRVGVYELIFPKDNKKDFE